MKKSLCSLIVLAGSISIAVAQQKGKPEDTEFYTPVPPKVTPASIKNAPLHPMPLFYLMVKTLINGLLPMTLPSLLRGM